MASSGLCFLSQVHRLLRVQLRERVHDDLLPDVVQNHLPNRLQSGDLLGLPLRSGLLQHLRANGRVVLVLELLRRPVPELLWHDELLDLLGRHLLPVGLVKPNVLPWRVRRNSSHSFRPYDCT